MLPKGLGILFNPNGCLSRYAIHSYTKGTLRSNEKARVEDHLKSCELCTEALRGYKSHKRTRWLHRDVDFLSRRIRRRYIQNGSRPTMKLYIFLVLTIAAILILLALLYLLYRYFQIGQEQVQGTLIIGYSSLKINKFIKKDFLFFI